MNQRYCALPKYRFKWFILSAIALITVSSWSCTISSNSEKAARRLPDTAEVKTQTSKSKVSSDVLELSKYIVLPYRPTAVLWQTAIQGNASNRVPGPTDWELTAILTFSQADVEKIVAEAALQENPYVDSVQPQEWFPPELKAYVVKDANTGEYQLQGKVYSAIAFTKLSLRNGLLLRVGETQYLLLHLYTT